MSKNGRVVRVTKKGSWPNASRIRAKNLGVGVALLAFGAIGCESKEVKSCHAAMQVSQELLLVMDQGSREAVESTLAAVKSAHRACTQAELRGEVKDTQEAIRNLENLLEMHTARVTKVKPAAPSAEQIQKLAKEGDPNCPRGQAYQEGTPPVMIRCTGAVLVEMGAVAARRSLEADRFKLLSGADDKVVKAEFGSGVIILEYAAADSSDPPLCVRATSKPGVPWQETAMRVTGVPPQTLIIGQPLRVGERTLALSVEGAETQQTVLIGACSPPSLPPNGPSP